MTLEEKINEEIKAAAKAGNKLRLETMRSIRAAIIEFNKSGSGKVLDEEEETKLLLHAAKKRRDAIEMYEKGERYELAAKEEQELAFIEEFLPKQMSEDEVRKTVDSIIADLGASDMKDMGKVMGAAMQQMKGKADGKFVQTVVREKLS